jgi:hypothetical protein
LAAEIALLILRRRKVIRYLRLIHGNANEVTQ